MTSEPPEGGNPSPEGLAVAVEAPRWPLRGVIEAPEAVENRPSKPWNSTLNVARPDGKPLDSSDLAALRFIVKCHDQEHAAPVSDDEAARIASLATPAPLPATGTGGE